MQTSRHWLVLMLFLIKVTLNIECMMYYIKQNIYVSDLYLYGEMKTIPNSITATSKSHCLRETRVRTTYY